MAHPIEQSSNSILSEGVVIPGGMAHLGGVSSNTLFDILAKWNEVLKSLENPANDPERDICGVVG